MRRFILLASVAAAIPAAVLSQTNGTFRGGRALTLTANDGNHEEWIRVTRSCPGPSSCDDGRGGFTSQVERSPGLERLGSASGTFYTPHSATVRFSASLTDGSVPAGHYLKIYWQGWPKDEDPACRASSGSTCSISRQVAPVGTPYAPVVCAAVVYESGGTNLAGGYESICVNVSYRDAPVATSFAGGRALTLTVNDGGREEWIRATRACPTGASCDNGRGGFTTTIERSPGMQRLGATSGSFSVAHSATVRFTASITDGTVPVGHYLKIYWQGWPKDEDPACRANSGAACSISRQMAPAGTPYAPVVCATLAYESGGTNLAGGYEPICVNMGYR